MDDTHYLEEPQVARPQFRLVKIITAVTCLLVIIAAVLFVYSQTPASFQPGTVIHVGKNMTVSSVASVLAEKNVIKSALLFRLATIVVGHAGGTSGSVGAGDYLFTSPDTVWHVAYRFLHNEEDLNPFRVTLPEGITVKDMATALQSAFKASEVPSISVFDPKTFLKLASTSEGYLFPDTYFFNPNISSADVVSKLEDNFNQKIDSIGSIILAFQASTSHSVFITPPVPLQTYPRTVAHIVTMASILEREATSTMDRRIVAGILWKRLDAGMPLGIDPPFMYILGKTSAELTVKDLATTSPYNTYIHKGLPPTPIDNPGLDALTDAVTPVSTDYWFYLNDSKGIMHYAATYAGHLANKAKFVK